MLSNRDQVQRKYPQYYLYVCVCVYCLELTCSSKHRLVKKQEEEEEKKTLHFQRFTELIRNTTITSIYHTPNSRTVLLHADTMNTWDSQTPSSIKTFPLLKHFKYCISSNHSCSNSTTPTHIHLYHKSNTFYTQTLPKHTHYIRIPPISTPIHFRYTFKHPYTHISASKHPLNTPRHSHIQYTPTTNTKILVHRFPVCFIFKYHNIQRTFYIQAPSKRTVHPVIS